MQMLADQIPPQERCMSRETGRRQLWAAMECSENSTVPVQVVPGHAGGVKVAVLFVLILIRRLSFEVRGEDIRN